MCTMSSNYFPGVLSSPVVVFDEMRTSRILCTWHMLQARRRVVRDVSVVYLSRRIEGVAFKMSS